MSEEIEKLVISVEMQDNTQKGAEKVQQSAEKTVENMQKEVDKAQKVAEKASEKTQRTNEKAFEKTQKTNEKASEKTQKTNEKAQQAREKNAEKASKTEIKQFQQSADKISDIMDTTTKGIVGSFTTGMGSIAAGFGLGFGVKFISDIVQQGAELKYLGITLQADTEKLQFLQQLFKRVNISGGKQNASSFVQQVYSGIRDNSSQVYALLGKLGIETKNILNRDTADVAKDIVLSFRKFNTTKQQLLQHQAQGILPPELLALGKMSNPEFNQQVENINKAGLSSKEQTEQMDAAQKRFDDIAQAWKKIGNDLTTFILPGLEGITKLANVAVHPIGAINNLINDKSGKRELTIPDKLLYNFLDWAVPSDGNKKGITNTKSADLSPWATNTSMNLDKFGDEVVPPLVIDGILNKPKAITQPNIKPSNQAVPPLVIDGVTNRNNYTSQFNNTQIQPANLQAQPQQNNSNTSTSNVVNVHGLTLQGVQNPVEFSQSLSGLAQTGWSYSGALR